jgi:hypothetical protein
MPMICQDFYALPDNTPFPQLPPLPPAPSNFTLGIFGFRQLGGTDPLFVNVTDAPGSLFVPGKGLQFPPPGLEITPLFKRARATLSIGTFSQAVEVTALDRSGAVLALVVVPANNRYNTVPIQTRRRIDRFVLTGGGFEGVFERICMTI